MNKADEIDLLQSEAGRRLANKNEPKDAASIVSDLFEYAENGTFVVEALLRLNEAGLASTALKKWQVPFKTSMDERLKPYFPPHMHPDADIFTRIAAATSKTPPLDRKKIIQASRSLEAFSEGFVLPKFSKPEHWSLIQKGVSLIGGEVLFGAKNAPNKTDEVRAELMRLAGGFFGEPDLYQMVLLDRYANDFTSYDVKQVLGALNMVTNETVKNVLNYMPQLRVLDLRDCYHLTLECLAKGHPKLEKLILDGTGIDPLDIDSAQFPSL